jgi:DNA-binding transcriptional LysR family regulator
VQRLAQRGHRRDRGDRGYEEQQRADPAGVVAAQQVDEHEQRAHAHADAQPAQRDAAIVLDPGEVAGALDFGPLTLRWYTGAGVAHGDDLPDPLPMVAYDEPCHMRDLAMARVRELGLAPAVTAQSPHLSGIQSAVRSGLGYTLLADGGDGLRVVGRGPLAEPIQARLWLLLRPADQALTPPLRAAMWRATAARHQVAA